MITPLHERSLETAIKATYLYKLPAFVEWPTGTFSSPSSPVVICIIGPDPFGSLLDEAVRNQTIGQRPIEVRRSGGPEGGHVAYGNVYGLRGRPILTVTDAARDGRGIVNFVLHENRVRYEIDCGAAAESGLTISPRVLALALVR